MKSRDVRKRILIICAHFHDDRTTKKDFRLLQPSVGLQIAALIDHERYVVRLHLEMWHGSLDPDHLPEAEIVFLNGLAKDLDRQRQLSYFYRRRGTIVVAGGYACTMFPEFASQFFDVTCAGGVDSVRQVMADYEAGALQPIYRSPQTQLSDYRIRYEALAENGINPPAHLVEASRGCNFKCDFCVIPAEGARHTKFGVERVMQSIDDAIRTSPRFSIRRWVPNILFIDNNFSNDPKYLRELCGRLRAHRRVRAWGALVTQDVLRNRKIIAEMAASGCGVLFTGLESLDIAFLRKHDKLQNLSKGSSIVEDIAFAQSQGIVVIYGYLFDPRITTIAELRRQLDDILGNPALLFPSFISVVSPLVGTKLFWQALDARELRPNLRLRDIDALTVVYGNCRNSDAELTEFLGEIYRTPDRLVAPRRHWMDFLRRSWALRRAPLMTHVVHMQAHFRLMQVAKARAKARAQTYISDSEVLDPQYDSWPADITPADKARYFDPIAVTDENGAPAAWLKPYDPNRRAEGARNELMGAQA